MFKWPTDKTVFLPGSFTLVNVKFDSIMKVVIFLLTIPWSNPAVRAPFLAPDLLKKRSLHWSTSSCPLLPCAYRTHRNHPIVPFECVDGNVRYYHAIFVFFESILYGCLYTCSQRSKYLKRNRTSESGVVICFWWLRTGGLNHAARILPFFFPHTSA